MLSLIGASLDAFGIHGVGGAIGAVLTGVFATSAVNFGSGLVDGNAGQVWIQIKGLAATAGYCAIATFVILKAIDMTIGLRVKPEQEIEGLDLHLQGETAQGWSYGGCALSPGCRRGRAGQVVVGRSAPAGPRFAGATPAQSPAQSFASRCISPDESQRLPPRAWTCA
ncbi:MAG: hypothetical protein SGJ07_02095 [Rhodospirillaceae bacterium]|nr:hypothetical protein [Rhodospirillaceae bacterium]